MPLITSKYRTGVVNDFSIVSKAVIYIFEKKFDAPIDQLKYSLKEKLPVQINPSSLLLNHSVKASTLQGLIGDSSHQVTGPTSTDDNATLRFTLVYDIYDEYNIATADGILGNDGASTSSLSDFSLANEKVTSLPKMIEFCGKNDKYALFRWGEMRFFGLISEVNCEYEAFSRWGQPLKCKADVVLMKQALPGLDASDYLLQCFGSEAAKIVSYETPSNIANRAALVALQALR